VYLIYNLQISYQDQVSIFFRKEENDVPRYYQVPIFFRNGIGHRASSSASQANIHRFVIRADQADIRKRHFSPCDKKMPALRVASKRTNESAADTNESAADDTSLQYSNATILRLVTSFLQVRCLHRKLITMVQRVRNDGMAKNAKIASRKAVLCSIDLGNEVSSRRNENWKSIAFGTHPRGLTRHFLAQTKML
jgi:hypothetical protein